MRTRRVVALAGMLLVASVFVACQGSSWVKYEPAGGRFSVEMPSAPVDKPQTIATAVGNIELHFAQIETEDDAAYNVSWADYPAAVVAAGNADTILDGARDGAISNVKGTLLGSSNIMLSGKYPGRDFHASLPDGKHVFRERIYLIGNRLYQQFVGTTTAGATSPDVTRFLDSFVPSE